MNKFSLLSLLLIILTTSCSSSYTVEGTNSLTQLNGKTVYLKLFINNEWVTVNSADIIHSNFKMTGEIKEYPLLTTLFIDNLPITPLILEPGNISINLNRANLTIQGTALNNKLNIFHHQKQALDFKLNEAFVNDKTEHIYCLNDAREALIKEFALNNKENILGPTIISFYNEDFPELLSNEDIKELLSSPFYITKEEMEYRFTDVESFIDLTFIDFLLW